LFEKVELYFVFDSLVKVILLVLMRDDCRRKITPKMMSWSTIATVINYPSVISPAVCWTDQHVDFLCAKQMIGVISDAFHQWRIQRRGWGRPLPYRPDASKNIWKFCTKMRYFSIKFSKNFLEEGIAPSLDLSLPLIPSFWIRHCFSWCHFIFLVTRL